DLGCVVGAGVVLDDGAVAHQRLALPWRQPIVVPQVDGGGGDAVDGAPGQQEGIQGSKEDRAREDAEWPDRVIDQVRPAVVAGGGQEPAFGGGAPAVPPAGGGRGRPPGGGGAREEPPAPAGALRA